MLLLRKVLLAWPVSAQFFIFIDQKINLSRESLLKLNIDQFWSPAGFSVQLYIIVVLVCFTTNVVPVNSLTIVRCTLAKLFFAFICFLNKIKSIDCFLLIDKILPHVQSFAQVTDYCETSQMFLYDHVNHNRQKENIMWWCWKGVRR